PAGPAVSTGGSTRGASSASARSRSRARRPRSRTATVPARTRGRGSRSRRGPTPPAQATAPGGGGGRPGWAVRERGEELGGGRLRPGGEHQTTTQAQGGLPGDHQLAVGDRQQQPALQ